MQLNRNTNKFRIEFKMHRNKVKVFNDTKTFLSFPLHYYLNLEGNVVLLLIESESSSHKDALCRFVEIGLMAQREILLLDKTNST